ncbi:hypothetical protein [Dyella silvatica]|uniref:hypothetical protein n=1 Tax=Dyella silvatica TaxID=2992128 RepID=UPI002254393F|nr:hypothetical protein [Dyella silvatica]
MSNERDGDQTLDGTKQVVAVSWTSSLTVSAESRFLAATKNDRRKQAAWSVSGEEQDVFEWLKKKSATPPELPKPRLSGYPTFSSDELMVTFGLTETQAEITRNLYEAMVAGEVRDPVAQGILAQPGNGPQVKALVGQAIGQFGRKDKGVLGVMHWLSFVGLVRNQTQRMLDNAITEGKWMSGDWTDCATHATAHRTLNDRRFPLAVGLAFDGVVERPGVRPECKCRVTPIIDLD